MERTGGAPLLVLTHLTPDPDALGALVGVRRLVGEGFGLPVRVATAGRIHRAENRAMVRELELAFEPLEAAAREPGAGVVLVDSQPGFGHTVLPEGLPVLAVFDHHEVSGAAAARLAAVPHADVRPELGATSSLVYAYLRDSGVGLDRSSATALFCGVRFDTGDLAFDVTPLDEEAYFETLRRADRLMVARILRPPLPPAYYGELRRSLQLSHRHGPLVLGLLGRVGNPESVAEMADFYLRMEGCHVAIVGGAFEDTYSLSVRTDPRRLRARAVLERLLDGAGTFGGHGGVAGARIPLAAHDPLGSLDVDGLEAELRGRALAVVADAGDAPSDGEGGRPLSS